MKKLINIVSVIALAVFLSSCASLAEPLFVTDNPVGNKVGIAKRTIFLGLAFGHTDLSIKTAAKNGGISKVATVDYKTSAGFLSTTYETIVTGE